MPKKSLNQANSITDKQLIPDLRKKIKGKTSGISYVEYINAEPEVKQFQYVAGESIPPDRLLNLNNGVLTVAFGKEAHCYTFDGGDINDLVTVIFDGIIDKQVTDSLLFNNNGIIDVEPSESYIQTVGFRLDENQIKLNIQVGAEIDLQ